jgi:hypothetical protein
MRNFLIYFGLIFSTVDSRGFYLQQGGETTLIAIWVDDGLVACSNKQTVLEIFQYFQLESEIV